MLFLFQEQAHELTLRLALPVPWMVMMAISAMSGWKFKTWHMPCEGRTHCFYFCFKAFWTSNGNGKLPLIVWQGWAASFLYRWISKGNATWLKVSLYIVWPTSFTESYNFTQRLLFATFDRGWTSSSMEKEAQPNSSRTATCSRLGCCGCCCASKGPWLRVSVGDFTWWWLIQTLWVTSVFFKSFSFWRVWVQSRQLGDLLIGAAQKNAALAWQILAWKFEGCLWDQASLPGDEWSERCSWEGCAPVSAWKGHFAGRWPCAPSRLGKRTCQMGGSRHHAAPSMECCLVIPRSRICGRKHRRPRRQRRNVFLETPAVMMRISFMTQRQRLCWVTLFPRRQPRRRQPRWLSIRSIGLLLLEILVPVQCGINFEVSIRYWLAYFGPFWMWHAAARAKKSSTPASKGFMRMDDWCWIWSRALHCFLDRICVSNKFVG